MTTRKRAVVAAAAISVLSPTLAEAASPAPTLDCGAGIEASRATAASLPGATAAAAGSFDLVRAEDPGVWIVEYAFTTAGHPAHPAATLRTRIKQVTGVWTSQSKGCGYGDQAQFSALMAEMKAQDSELTNASRNEVERNRPSPIGAAP